jgi:poly-gamma-glutamate synthesis protein (capsule biosynthesis protein)
MYEEDAGDITLAFVGDALVTRRMNVHREPEYQRMAQILRAADATMANAETLFHRFEAAPVPDSGPYGTYAACDPDVIDDLRWLGIDLVSTANNHCVDYGEAGLVANLEHLRRHGMPFAGTGRSLSEASAPTYLDTARGSVAMVAVTLTMPPGDHRAGEPRGRIPARPGANVLRHSSTQVLPSAAFDALAEIGRGMALGRHFRGEADTLELFGHRYERGGSYQTRQLIDAADLDRNLRRIDEARALADWVVVSVHNHESGADREEPAAFAVEFAHRCVDAGADVVFGHGPHLDRGIEIYQGRPILYALGNFILHNELIKDQPADLADRFGLPAQASTAEIYRARSARFGSGQAADPRGLRSAIAVVGFRGWQLSTVELHPLDLGVASTRGSQRGRPMLAGPPVADEVLETFRRLSEPFGTTIEIGDGRGRVRC